VHVEDLEVREIQDFLVDTLQVVVAEVDPLQVLVVPHHIVQHFVQPIDRLHFVVLQEEA
jgi:hypothetical protein